jgi:hypothetical protein
VWLRTGERSGLGFRLLTATVAAVLTTMLPQLAQAASFSAKDILVLGRAIAFMLPPPAADAIIAVAYTSGDPASRRDAESIVAMIGTGLQVGKTLLQPKLVDVGALAATGFVVVIAAAGANGPQLGAAARTSRVLCVTTDVEAVRAALCTMAITSEPRVEIVVNHAVAATAGVEFAAAFRMMIHEI